MNKTKELKFDIRDVQTKNPKTANQVPSHLYRTDHKIPKKYLAVKKWWDR